MKSTISFTATVALDAGGTIAVQADDVPIAGADLFDLVGMMFEQVPPGILAATGLLAEPSASTARTLHAEPAPTPTVTQVQKVHQPPKDIEVPAPESLKVAPKRGENPGKQLPGDAAPGTCAHALLTAVAEEGGIYEGSLADLARTRGTGAEASRIAMASQMNRAGLFDSVPRTGPVKLTPAGWAALGRPVPDVPGAPKATAPNPLAAVPDPPKVPDLGPIEKLPFDPDRVRQQQANAL